MRGDQGECGSPAACAGHKAGLSWGMHGRDACRAERHLSDQGSCMLLLIFR